MAALTALLVVAGAATSGVGGALVMVGLVAAVTAVVALLRGRLAWARIASRGTAAAVLGGSLVLLIVGGALTPPTPVTPAAAADKPGSTPSASPTTSATPTATQSPTSTATQTPSATPTTPPDPTRVALQQAAPGTALAALAKLDVKGRAPKTGYARAAFGPAWADTDHNGCDTRNDVLRRDLKRYVLKAGTHGCLVLKGSLADPYTGKTVAFARGSSTSTRVQIDHVVSLSDAWQKGAQSWSSSKRERFANDSLNLLAVDGPTNASKSDGDAATWLPPSRAYRCWYVARQVAVKAKYDLAVTKAERTATVQVLSRCSGTGLPTGAVFQLGGGTVQKVAKPKPKPAVRRHVSKPSKPSGPSTVPGTVHPGSFCAPGGALGRTVTGLLMRCQTSATDDRNRWRRA